MRSTIRDYKIIAQSRRSSGNYVEVQLAQTIAKQYPTAQPLAQNAVVYVRLQLLTSDA